MNSALAPQPSRRVRHLRIRSPAEAEARRASIVLADALHTASMPVAERGQMLLVRKLELGRISPSASAATLALLVERALREVQMAAVPFDLPAATGANAVLIPGRAEAIARLARLHARGIEAREWFWTAAMPAWGGGLSRSERWVALLEAAHALPEAVLVAAEVVREAVGAGVEDELLGALSTGQIRNWLRVEGWSLAAPAEASAREVTPHAAPCDDRPTLAARSGRAGRVIDLDCANARGGRAALPRDGCAPSRACGCLAGFQRRARRTRATRKSKDAQRPESRRE